MDPLRAPLVVRVWRGLYVLKPVLLQAVRSPGWALGLLQQIRQDTGRSCGEAAKRVLLEQSEYLRSHRTVNEVWRDYLAHVNQLKPGRSSARSHGPLISVVVSTYGQEDRSFGRMLESVLEQTYPTWELVVWHATPGSPRLRKLIDRFSARDARVRRCGDATPRGWSQGINGAAAESAGTFLVILGSTYALAPHALLRVAQCVEREDPEMLYADEVVFGERGHKALDFVMRPMFSPEYLRNRPYVGNALGISRKLFCSLGGLQHSIEPYAVHDLVLRGSEVADRIAHIPEILFKCTGAAPPPTTEAASGHLASSSSIVRDHLLRTGAGSDARARPDSWTVFPVYDVRQDVRVAIIIPTKNQHDLLRRCVDSIERTVKHVSYFLVVVDHASDEPQSIAYLDELRLRHTVLRYDGSFNFSKINNWAASQLGASCTHLLFCNNDIEALEAGWLDRMIELGQQPDVGIVGAMLLYAEGGSIQHAGDCVGLFGTASQLGKHQPAFVNEGRRRNAGYCDLLVCSHELSAVTGACMLMRHDAFDQVCGFDESFSVGFGDVDLCLRNLQQGFRVVYCADALLIHHESVTRGRRSESPHPEDTALFLKRWASVLEAGDPYYSPGLSITSSSWEFKSVLPVSENCPCRLWKRDARIGGRLMAQSLLGRPGSPATD